MINKIGENTENIRYVGNTWQKSGSIDNAKCMYTPENLLNLLYKDTGYTKGKFEYTARKDVTLDNNSPALLSHDLILVNTHYYTGTADESGNVIYTLTDYLKYGISISNPIYSITSKTKFIPLINIEKVKSGDCDLANYTLKQFAEMFKFGNSFVLNIDNITGFLKKKYDYTEDAKNPTMQFFLNSLTEDNQIKFVEDFSLPYHDPESIRLPFHKQIVEDFEEKQNFNRISTRFVMNSAPIHKPEKFGVGSRSYVEKLSDVVEMALTGVTQQTEEDSGTAEYTYFGGGTIEPSSLDINAKECWLKPEEHAAIQNKLDNIEKTNQLPVENVIDLKSAQLMLTQLSNVSTAGGLSSILPPVYLGFSQDKTMYSDESALAIQLNIPQDKATVLVNDEDYETWDIFGGVVLGYKLVDALIAQRTFIGSVWGLGIVSEIDYNGFDMNEPLYKNIKGYPEVVYNDQGESLHYTYENEGQNYLTIDLLNKLYLKSNNIESNEVLSTPVLNWLQNECVLFKAPYFGDFVEEKNFEQDLTPHSTVEFQTLLVDEKKSNKSRYADSLTRKPYMEQTAPLINYSNESKEGKHASKSFPSIGTLRDEKAGFFVTPPFLYDEDKGDESHLLAGQKPIYKNSKGDARIESRIISETIDELWSYIKYLSEDTVEGLPEFYGMTAEGMNGTESPLSIRVNPKYAGQDVRQIDILKWSPNQVEEFLPEYSNDENPELIYKGWKVDKFITKVLDYKVKPFTRGQAEGVYPYNTEDEDSNVTGYLTQIYNSALLAFNLLEDSFNTVTLDDGEGYVDEKLYEGSKGLSNTRSAAQTLLARILNYESDLHIHYKQYLNKPKNLKAIERDLETIRQNLQTLSEYLVATFASRGFADRNTNRGTLHTLHRNAFDFEDTFLKDDRDSLDNFSDDLTVESLDKKVVYEGGDEKRFIHPDNTYSTLEGKFGICNVDLSDPIQNTRNAEGFGEANHTLLRDVYMSAEGVYRSIHEETIFPIVDDEF